MPPVGFEPTISAGERPQTYALDPRGHWDRLSKKIEVSNWYRNTEYNSKYYCASNRQTSNWIPNKLTSVIFHKDLLKNKDMQSLKYVDCFPPRIDEWRDLEITARIFWLSVWTGRFLWTECVECKGKAIPLQAWTGPEDSRMFSLPDFKKKMVHEGGNVVFPTHRPPYPPENIPGAHFC